MKRAEDFRKFMGIHRTLKDSMDLLPDCPEGAEYLQRVVETGAFASDDPYAPSVIRAEGLQIWDSVFLPFPRCVPFDPVRLGSAPVLRAGNSSWDETKKSLEMIGRADGIHYLRPKGEFIFDLLNDDIRMIQGAHVLTHRARRDIADDDYTFGEFSGTFIENLVRMVLCRKYGIGIDAHPENGRKDGLDSIGVEVAGSFDLRAPEMVVGFDRMIRDKTVAVVLGSVGIEAPPSAEGWKEVDKWANLPTLVALAGWECVDFISHAARTDMRGELQPIVSVPDLQGMDTFGEMLEAAERNGRERVPPGTVPVDDWLGSQDFQKGLAVTPQLPCPHCIRPNRKSPGTVRKPRSPKPKSTFKEIVDIEYKGEETKAWIDYVEFMRRCISIGRKATAYALGSSTSVKRRNSAFRKKTDTLRRITSLTDRMHKKLENGFVSEAGLIRVRIDEMRKGVE